MPNPLSSLASPSAQLSPPVPILCYHRVAADGGEFSTTPELFRQHLDLIAQRGFETLSLAQLTERIAEPTTASGRPGIVVTFDDGYRDLETEVAPALAERGQRAVAFLITSRNPATSGDGDYLGWASARALAADGLFEFHSHSHTHQKWPLEASQAPVIAEELRTSRAILATELDAEPETFDHIAWPFARTCEAWEETALELGFTTQYIVQRGAVRRPGQLHRLPRLLTDGMGLAQLRTWLTVLTSPVGATAGNRVFGAIRHVRRGAAYT